MTTIAVLRPKNQDTICGTQQWKTLGVPTIWCSSTCIGIARQTGLWHLAFTEMRPLMPGLNPRFSGQQPSTGTGMHQRGGEGDTRNRGGDTATENTQRLFVSPLSCARVEYHAVRIFIATVTRIVDQGSEFEILNASNCSARFLVNVCLKIHAYSCLQEMVLMNRDHDMLVTVIHHSLATPI